MATSWEIVLPSSYHPQTKRAMGRKTCAIADPWFPTVTCCARFPGGWMFGAMYGYQYARYLDKPNGKIMGVCSGAYAAPRRLRRPGSADGWMATARLRWSR